MNQILSAIENGRTLGFLVNRTARMMSNTLRKAFLAAGYDVTPEQWGILSRLWQEDGISQQALADKNYKDKTNINRLINGLEKRQLIVRMPNKLDKRNKLIYLTPAGKALRLKLLPIVKNVLQQATEEIAAEEQQLLESLLDKIYFNLSQTDEKETLYTNSK